MEKTIDPRAGHYCRDCKFFDTVTNLETKQVVNVCRRNAPHATAQLLMMNITRETPQGPRQEQVPNWTQYTLWPIVNYTDWCGEFIPNRSKQ